MKIFTKFLMLIALLFVQLGGVKAEDHYGVFPTCIDNFQYEDYSIFVGKKHVKFTWEVKNAAEAANYKIYYYIADERTLYNGTNDKGNDSWSQLRMYSYGTKYDWTYEGNTYTKRFTHIDQGPWAKDGREYNSMLGDYPKKHALDPGENDTPTTGIGTVTSMNPLLVGRSIKWDDPTEFANGEKVVKTCRLDAGELDLGETDKSLCVFFIIKNMETEECYYGPDKQTNSETAGTRHFSYSILPWNGCWMSVNLCVPMPIKVSWSSTEDGDYTEVACGTDVKFPGNDVWVKLELDTSFPLADVSENYDIWFNTSSLLPLRVNHNNAGDDIDSYDEYYIESKKYTGPIHLERNTVIRYSIWDGDTQKFGQVHTSGFATMGEESVFEESKAYDKLNDKIGLSYPEYSIYPIYNELRKHYMWGNTFVQEDTKTIELPFSGGVPYSSWTEYLTGKFGLGSGTYTYQTYVPEKALLIPSSLEGILDFFIILYGDTQEITGQTEGEHEGGTRSSPYLSRINWVPEGMPVIVRYRNYSAANSLETPDEAKTNMDNLKRQLTGDPDNDILPAYFMSKDFIGENSSLSDDFFANQLKGSFKNYYGGQSSLNLGDATENVGLDVPYYDPVTGETITLKYEQQKDGDGNPLYQPITKKDSNGADGYELLDSDGNPLYEVLTKDGEKLYYYDIDYRYQITDENGKRLWMLADENGTFNNYVQNSNDEFLYHYKDGSGNRMYQKHDGTNLVYQDVDNENRLFHMLNDEGEKLYYEYYTVGEDKNHFYLVTDESGNPKYQTVNSSGDRLYYQYDAEGNPVYQKCNANGEPLYYKCLPSNGVWERRVFVYGYIEENLVLDAEMNESQISTLSGFPGKLDIQYIEKTENELKDDSATKDQPLEGNEVPASESDTYKTLMTTTTPNAHPVIDNSGTSDVPAYTTAQYDDNLEERTVATTTTQGDWPVTITAGNEEYTTYVNNNTLYPVETTTATGYPVLQTTENDYPFVGTADAERYDGYTVDVNDAYVIQQWGSSIPTEYASIYHDSNIPVTVTEDDPDFKTYWDNWRLRAYVTDENTGSYPFYCGRYGYDDEIGYTGDLDSQGEETYSNYPVLITERSLEGYNVQPAVWDDQDANNDPDYYSKYQKGESLVTVNYPVLDYEKPVQRKWTTKGFIDINDFPDYDVSDYVKEMEPQIFKVYDGTTDRAYWFPDYNVYHLSSFDHRDEGNFKNILHNVTVNTAVSELEEDGKYVVMGLGIDHTNEWVGANIERSSGDEHVTWTAGELGVDWYESVVNRLLKGGVESNDDIGLHLTAFTNKYSALLTDSARQTPVLDDWLVYAGDYERGMSWYPNPSEPSNYSHGYDYQPFPFYYGFFLRDHTTRCVWGEASNYGYDYRNSLASAAWRTVKSSGTIKPGKVFLLYDEEFVNEGSFYQWWEWNYDHRDKLNIISGTTLSPSMTVQLSDIVASSVKEYTTAGTSKEGDGAVYDLQGRKVLEKGSLNINLLPKGVYIKDGKKFVVK